MPKSEPVCSRPTPAELEKAIAQANRSYGGQYKYAARILRDELEHLQAENLGLRELLAVVDGCPDCAAQLLPY